jgi:hypothetical protein
VEGPGDEAPGVGCSTLLAELEAGGSGSTATGPPGPSTRRFLISRPPSSSKTARSSRSSMPRLTSWPMQASGEPKTKTKRKVIFLSDNKKANLTTRRQKHLISLTMMPLYLNPVGGSDRVDENVGGLSCLVLSSAACRVFSVVGGAIM